MSTLLTISYGDTAEGAAAMEEVLEMMVEAGAVFEVESVQLGKEMVKLDWQDGFDPEGLNKIRRAGALLKAPTEQDVTTPLRAKLGPEVQIFEAVAPTKEAALKAAVEMLEHFGMGEIAQEISR